MALKFTKGKPTTHGLYAFSSDGKNRTYYYEINSITENYKQVDFYCYLGPIPVIEPPENLKKLSINEILGKMIDKKPIIVKNKETGKTVKTVIPFSIAIVDDLVIINNEHWVFLNTFWEKDE